MPEPGSTTGAAMRKSSGGSLCAGRAAEHVGRTHALQGMPRARRRERVGLCMLGLLMTLGPADFSVASAGTGSTGVGANALRGRARALLLAGHACRAIVCLCVYVSVCLSLCVCVRARERVTAHALFSRATHDVTAPSQLGGACRHPRRPPYLSGMPIIEGLFCFLIGLFSGLF